MCKYAILAFKILTKIRQNYMKDDLIITIDDRNKHMEQQHVRMINIWINRGVPKYSNVGKCLTLENQQHTYTAQCSFMQYEYNYLNTFSKNNWNQFKYI